MCLLSFLKWGSIGYSLGILQWDFTRRDHPRNHGRYMGRVLSSGLLKVPADYEPRLVFDMETILRIKRKHFKGNLIDNTFKELITFLEFEENALKETLLTIPLKKVFIDNTS